MKIWRVIWHAERWHRWREWPPRRRLRLCNEQNETLFQQLQRVHGLSDAQMTRHPRDIREVRHHEPGQSGGHPASGDAGGGAGQS